MREPAREIFLLDPCRPISHRLAVPYSGGSPQRLGFMNREPRSRGNGRASSHSTNQSQPNTRFSNMSHSGAATTITNAVNQASSWPGPFTTRMTTTTTKSATLATAHTRISASKTRSPFFFVTSNRSGGTKRTYCASESSSRTEAKRRIHRTPTPASVQREEDERNDLQVFYMGAVVIDALARAWTGGNRGATRPTETGRNSGAPKGLSTSGWTLPLEISCETIACQPRRR